MKKNWGPVIWIGGLVLTAMVFFLSLLPVAGVLWFGRQTGNGTIVLYPSYYSFWDPMMLGYAEFGPVFSVSFLLGAGGFSTLSHAYKNKRTLFCVLALAMALISLLFLCTLFLYGVKYFTPIAIVILCFEVAVVLIDVLLVLDGIKKKAESAK